MNKVRSNPAGAIHQRHERYPVSCEIDGDVFTGNYWIAGRILVVSTATGGTSRQLANQQPEDLAKVLLRSFVLANREGTLAIERRNHCSDGQPNLEVMGVAARQDADAATPTTSIADAIDPNTAPRRYGKS